MNKIFFKISTLAAAITFSHFTNVKSDSCLLVPNTVQWRQRVVQRVSVWSTYCLFSLAGERSRVCMYYIVCILHFIIMVVACGIHTTILYIAQYLMAIIRFYTWFKHNISKREENTTKRKPQRLVILFFICLLFGCCFSFFSLKRNVLDSQTTPTQFNAMVAIYILHFTKVQQRNGNK